MLAKYLKHLYLTYTQGDAREESYYPHLKQLLEDLANEKNIIKFQVTVLPKKTEAGNPDFRVWDGKQHIIGYIEAKDPSVKNLDTIEISEQLKRYRSTFPNLILTNFYEFRLYINGGFVESIQIARPFIVHKLKTVPPAENEDAFQKLLEKFFSFSLPKVYNAKNLAIELAKRTRFLKDEIIAHELFEENTTGHETLLGFYEAFKQFLIAGLSKEDFANLYSQTITYGLFAARTRADETFTRKLAFDNIPHTIGILRDVFRFISLGELPLQMEWIVDDISEVLSVADVNNILHRFYRDGKGSDPIIHFYETFLSEYDPTTRERRGVYYTPEPVVHYIVRSLHAILKNVFGRKDGLASDSVTVLDPAAGTLTFLSEAAKLAVKEFVGKYGEGGKDTFISDHILKNFYAFELIMAPYAIGHLKMSFLLEELGYKLKKDDRFRLYLTNTLEMEELSQTSLPGMSSLSEESHFAGVIKKIQPILVVLGNPPYSGHSSNFGEWISQEIKAYFQVDGKPLGEKNPKWLQDDYVKFIRFSQWKIEQSCEGVVGLITNHSYLDNPTFRGMRRSLMKTFTEIYILDLHGNSLKKEVCPDGSKDENVFDIRQGVAIILLIKIKNDKNTCNIFHSGLWGLREKKYKWLERHDFTKTKWKKISPKSDSYFFIPRDEKLLKSYQKYPKITEIFPVNSVGIVTSRDDFVIDFNKDALERRIGIFIDKKLPDEIIGQTYGLKDKSNWKISEARCNLRKDKRYKEAFTQILYRPFDIRCIFYHDEVIERSRRNVMQHMLQSNLALCIGRAGQVVGLEESWNIVFCSTMIEDFNLFYRGGNVNFPLFLYPEKAKSKSKSHIISISLFEPLAEYGSPAPNIEKTFFESLCLHYRSDPTPEQVLYYIYAVLYSNEYRTKYSEFLKTDFPRIPFVKEYKLFKKIGGYGATLADLHLMKYELLDKSSAKFQGKAENKVEKLKYEPKEKRLYINASQYFEGIEPEVWNYHIGGYQVCEKWLKDRKGRTLTLEEIKLYCKIVTSLKNTIKIQDAIDSIYPEVEKNIINF